MNADEIRQLAPTAREDIVDAIVRLWPEAEAAGIATPLRVQHFMAQLATETGGFSLTEENLNYSAARLRAVWPSRFPDDALAADYEHQPQRLANFVYANRIGNGPPESGDGWRYRGGGLIQTTGRENYRAAGFEDDPDALRRDPEMGFRAALEYWTRRDCNDFADADALEPLRRRVNGGLNGIDDARRYLARAKRIWPVDGIRDYSPDEVVEEVRRVQQALWDKGYAMVGARDGKYGRNTRDALNALRADNGLPAEQRHIITDSDLRALFAGPERPVSEARAATTAGDLRAAGSRTIRGSDIAAGGAVATGAVTVVGQIAEHANSVAQAAEPVQRAIGPLRAIWSAIGDLWWIVVPVTLVAVVVGIWMIRRARVDDQRSGRHA
ncbi:MAG: peptidoglycan-binding protein [Rhodospirillaceae bacterium]